MREWIGLVRHRGTFAMLVSRDFRARYRAKALGVLWSVGDPLIMMGIYWVVFTAIRQQPFPHYAVFLLLGLTPYRFFANGVSGAAASLVSNRALITRVAFPRYLLPASVIGSHAVHFLIELGLLVVVALLDRGALRWSVQWAWLPVVFALQLVLMMGLALLTSAMTVWYRDVQYLLNSVMRILFYVSPVFYPADLLTERFGRWGHLMALNPLAGLVISYRNCAMKGLPPAWDYLAVGGVVTLVLLAAGTLAFRRTEPVCADYI